MRRYGPGTKAVCFVDPHDPAQAVLQREFAPGMLIGLLPLMFFFVGVGGLAWAFSGGGRQFRFMPASEGMAPWLRRADWAAGRIVASAKPAMIGMWIFSGIWNLIALPFLTILMTGFAKSGDRLLLIGLIFPAIGFCLIIMAIRITARWKKFGESVFEMASVPGLIGGALQGTVRLSHIVRPPDGFKLKLDASTA